MGVLDVDKQYRGISFTNSIIEYVRAMNKVDEEPWNRYSKKTLNSRQPVYNIHRYSIMCTMACMLYYVDRTDLGTSKMELCLSNPTTACM